MRECVFYFVVRWTYKCPREIKVYALRVLNYSIDGRLVASGHCKIFVQ